MPDQRLVRERDDVAAAPEDLGRRQVGALREVRPAPAERVRQSVHRVDQPVVERQVLWRADRAAEDQQQAVVAGQVVAARPVHRQRPASGGEPVEEDRRQAQRVELEQALERHRLRRLERAPQLLDPPLDRGVGQPRGEPLALGSVEEQDRAGQELAQQVLGLPQPVLHRGEQAAGLHLRGELVGESGVGVHRGALRDAHGGDEVVHRAELLERLPVDADRLVVARQQAQHVGVELEVGGEDRRQRDHGHGAGEDAPRPPAGGHQQALDPRSANHRPVPPPLPTTRVARWRRKYSKPE